MTGRWTIGHRILIGTLAAGTLDIGRAVIEPLLKPREPAAMLRGLASGPFPDAIKWGESGAFLGLAVHFAIMAVIVTMFMVAHQESARIRRNTLAAAAVYGLAVWLVMYGVVLRLRFGVPFPNSDPVEIAKQLFAHVVLVGLTIGWVAQR